MRAEKTAQSSVYLMCQTLETAKDRMDGEPADVKAFFAAEIGEFEKLRRSGNDAKKDAHFVTASNFYAQAEAKAKDLKKSVVERSAYQSAVADCKVAKASADAVGAATARSEKYGEAKRFVEGAAEDVKSRQFANAAEKLKAATALFKNLRQDIIAAAVSEAESHFKAERWEACLDTAEKVLGWEPDQAKAAQLKEAANLRLVPTLRLMAKLGKREVPARILDGEKPVLLPLSFGNASLTANAPIPHAGVCVSFEEDGKWYAGRVPQTVVDWEGLKTVVVSLERSQLTYWVIDLETGKVSYRDAEPSGGWSDEYKTRKLVLRRIEAGSFEMGSPTDEDGRDSDETRHRVTLTKPYYIGVFEVTQGQWERVMDANPSKFQGPTRPVENVSYNDIRGGSLGAKWPSSSGVDAESFLGRLRAKTGLDGFDLPTEAQWGYACRAGTTTAHAGNLDEMGWYDGNSGLETHEAGTKRPNAWGLYDMHGNVWEWCLDWWNSYGGDATDPKGTASGDGRVTRGGSWSNSAGYCRSAYRFSFSPGNAFNLLGLRLYCSAGPAE